MSSPSSVARDRVDREIAALQVLLEGHRRRGVELEPRVTRRRFALRPRQRVLFAGVRMQEYRESLCRRGGILEPRARRPRRRRRPSRAP